MSSNRKVLSFLTLVLPWISTIFIDKKSFIRFLPSATFIGYLFALFSEIADKKRLWKVKNGLFPRYVLEVSYLYGLFPIVTIWILKLTYRNFFKYLLTNIVADYIFSFHIVKFFEKVGTFKFKKMSLVNFLLFLYYYRL